MRWPAAPIVAATLALAAAIAPRAARADEPGGAPEPLPPPTPPAPTTAAPAAPPPTSPAAPATAAPSSASPPATDAPPSRGPEKFAIWLGARAGVLTFGSAFYTNQKGVDEPAGNFARAGLGVELDAGVRLFKRFTPYVFWEHGFHQVGRRFEGDDAHAYSNFYGLGFRYLAGAIDDLGFGFLTDVSIGMRTVSVTSGASTYGMSALEIFRLGLGAEIRVSRMFSVTPLASISGGVMRTTSGNVKFSALGSTDGVTEPTFHDGKNIDNETTYLVLGLGAGGHFDLLGH